jgi:hypothetical protein
MCLTAYFVQELIGAGWQIIKQSMNFREKLLGIAMTKRLRVARKCLLGNA